MISFMMLLLTILFLFVLFFDCLNGNCADIVWRVILLVFWFFIVGSTGFYEKWKFAFDHVGVRVWSYALQTLQYLAYSAFQISDSNPSVTLLLGLCPTRYLVSLSISMLHLSSSSNLVVAHAIWFGSTQVPMSCHFSNIFFVFQFQLLINESWFEIPFHMCKYS